MYSITTMFQFDFVVAPTFKRLISNPNRIVMTYGYRENGNLRHTWYAFDQIDSNRLAKLLNLYNECMRESQYESPNQNQNTSWICKYESGELDKDLHILRKILPKIDPDQLMVSFPENFECNDAFDENSEFTFSTFRNLQLSMLEE